MKKPALFLLLSALSTAEFNLLADGVSYIKSNKKEKKINDGKLIKHNNKNSQRSKKYVGLRIGRSWTNTTYTNSALAALPQNNGKGSFFAENRGFDVGVVAGFNKQLNDMEISIEFGLDYNFTSEAKNVDELWTVKDPANPTTGSPVKDKILGERSFTLDADLKLGVPLYEGGITPRIILGFTVSRMEAFDHTDPGETPYQTPYGTNMGIELEGKLTKSTSVVMNYRRKNFYQGGLTGHAVHFGFNKSF